jgi:NAD(P)-dependent dehydrogenase (short-subunit alcohol dehydrogenase family)
MATIKDLINLRGRCALVTGANGKLGRTVVDTLAELGADLILVDRLGSNLQALGSEVSERWGVNVLCRLCDLEIESERVELIVWLKAQRESLSILINNAAFVGSSELDGWNEPFEGQTTATWRRALEVNLTAPFALCQGLLPLLQNAKGASIINIGSIYGIRGPDWALYEGTGMSNPAAYCASKGGLIQFTRWLATTVAPNVRANVISPGGIYRNQPSAFVSRYCERTPLGRMAIEDDFRGAVAYLASDLSKYVTGHNLVIDGGWSTW